MNKSHSEETAFYRIHHINTFWNKRLAPVLYLLSAFSVFLLTILPYRGRVAFAFFVNIFFNRPVVYWNIISEKISKRFNLVFFFFFYFFVLGVYVFFLKIYQRFFKKYGSTWKPVVYSREYESFFYQS